MQATDDTGLPADVQPGPDTEPDSGSIPNEPEFVPAWLAVLVLVLLLAVVGVAGFVIRGLVSGEPRATSPAALQVNEWTAKVKEDPENPQNHLGLGYAYQMDGRYEQALQEYDTVLKTSPTDTAALYNKGVIYLKLDAGTKAEKSFWAVLDVEPTHALAAKALGEYYLSKGHYKSLVEAVRPAVQAHPEMADLQYLMAVAYENLGNTDWAIERYKLALKYSPDLVEAREGLARLGVTP